MRLKTLLAAAAMSIGLLAHAEYADKAMSFEGMTVDSPATVATELAAQDSATWDLQGNTDVAAKAYGAEASYEPRPSQFAIDTQDKYLSIKTPLTNGVIRAAGDATIDGAIYVDTLVKFTAADDDLDIPTDGKIAVWVKAMDEDGTENHIMVTAGPIVDQKPTTYDCGEISNLDAWHRLTIKVIGDVTNGDSQNGLVVYLDAKSDSADILFSDDAKAAFAGYTLSDVAAEYKRNGQLFPAMQSSATLASVEFAGQGSVDDIVYTETQPAFAADPMIYTVAWEAGVTAFDYTPYGGEKVSKTGLEGAGEDKFVWDGVNAPEVDETSIVPAEGKMASVDVGTGITTIKVSDLAATAIIDGEPATFSDIDAAVAAINNANASATLTLGANVDHDLTFTADIDLVIDLAGKTILADTANAICVEAGTVLVTNTTAEVGTVSANGVTDAYAFYYSGSAYATLAAGIFEGPVSADGYTICQGGQFSKEGNTEGGECVLTAAEGLEFTDTEVDGYWTLTEAQKEPFSGGDGSQATPYLISKVADLVELQEKVADGNNFEGKYFQQTEDIDFTGAALWKGIGSKDGSKYFGGIYDGNEKSIENVTFDAQAGSSNSYMGFFRYVINGTIKDLTIETDGFGNLPTAGFGGDYEYGGAVIVGMAKNATLSGLTAEGQIGTATDPTTHNAGGIVVQIVATTVENCTNNATLYCAYSKAAGIVVFTNPSTGLANGSAIIGCVNNGTIVGIQCWKNADGKRWKEGDGEQNSFKDVASDGFAGILAWTGDTAYPSAITNCSNTASITADVSGADHKGGFIGEILGEVSNTAIGSGNVGRTGMPLVGTVAAATTKATDFLYTADGAQPATLAAGGTFAIEVANEKSGYSQGKVAPTLALATDETVTFITNKCTYVVDFAGITASVEGNEIKEEVVDGGVKFTAAAKQQGWPEDPEDVKGQAAGDVYGETLPAALAKADAATVATWAKGVGAVAFADKATINTDAFLLNIANASTPEQIQAAKDAFKITGFAQSSDGTWVVTLTDPDGKTVYADGTYGNGKVVVESFSDVTCTTAATSGDQLFYKAKLVVAEVE